MSSPEPQASAPTSAEDANITNVPTVKQAKMCAAKRTQNSGTAHAPMHAHTRTPVDKDRNVIHACRWGNKVSWLPGGLGRGFLFSDFNYDSNVVCAIVIKEFEGVVIVSERQGNSSNVSTDLWVPSEQIYCLAVGYLRRAFLYCTRCH